MLKKKWSEYWQILPGGPSEKYLVESGFYAGAAAIFSIFVEYAGDDLTPEEIGERVKGIKKELGDYFLTD